MGKQVVKATAVGRVSCCCISAAAMDSVRGSTGQPGRRLCAQKTLDLVGTTRKAIHDSAEDKLTSKGY
jgi:hypothetical protein